MGGCRSERSTRGDPGGTQGRPHSASPSNVVSRSHSAPGTHLLHRPQQLHSHQVQKPSPPISQFHTLQSLRLVHTTRVGGGKHTQKTHNETSRKERVGMEPPPVTFLSLSALTRDSLPVSSQSQSTSKLSRAFKKSPESCANTSLRQKGTIWCLRKKLSQQEELENKI